MNINPDGLIEAYCVPDKEGEFYYDKGSDVHYWDRGVVVKRKAQIDGAPEAVVIIQGLARYQKMGNFYEFKEFFVSENRYEGIPKPNEDDLVAYVHDEILKVFMGRAHNITHLDKILLNEDPWVWHNARSFTANFTIAYSEIVSYTQIADRESTFSIRFYRDDLHSPLRNLLSSERERTELSRSIYSETEIRQMKTIMYD